MAPTYTTNLHLKKPHVINDPALVGDINANMDILDAAVSGPVRVAAYGAVGDGITDDSAAILAAVAAVPSGGGAIKFEAGKTYWAPTLTTITRSHLTIDLAGATLRTTATLKLTGDHNTIEMGGGTIDGGLRYTTVASGVGIGVSAIPVVDGTVFVVGDGVQSSYGLGGDGSNPDVITQIVGNTITVTSPTFGALPAGSRIGNWVFNATVSLDGDHNTLRNGSITLSRGIAIDVRTGSDQVLVENVRVTKSALQHIQVINATKVLFRACHFEDVLDAAKQSVGISGAVTEVAFVDCSFRPLNFDAIFFVGGVGAPSTDEASISLTRCSLDAINGVLQAPYSANGAVIYQNSAMIRSLTLRDCVVLNYRFGIATDVNSAVGTSARRVVLDGCDFSAGIAPYSWYAAGHVPTQVLQSTDCHFACSVTDFWATTGTFDGCVFDGCSFDAASNFGGRMSNCAFLSSSGVRFVASAYLDGCFFNATQIGTYPLSGADKLLGELHLGEVLFGHVDFPAGTLSNIVALQADHAMTGHLREKDSTLPVLFYVDHVGATQYLVDAPVYYQPYPTQLRNKDWRIPINSRFHRKSGTPATNLVTKSNSTTLNGAVVATATSIVVTSGSGFAIGDVLNILCTDGRVHTTIASSVSGVNIGLTDAMPTGASSGAGVCAYTYAPLVDGDAWLAYNPTWTGFSAPPTGGLRYKQVGKTVFVRSTITASGTSNATGLTFTLPLAAQSTQILVCYGLGIDNGVTVTTPARIDLSSTTVATCYKDPAATLWTNTGAKAIHFCFSYEAA